MIETFLILIQIFNKDIKGIKDIITIIYNA
jgi:hypothetical protein